ncbi:MAG: hypothetical protein A4E72_01222 [Syntrophus sp. PtaU1.Bin208]|nr:MAG: hypothetical protein A4E72_01222 [Syntrophus sp. PtaU1.Bin208]
MRLDEFKKGFIEFPAGRFKNPHGDFNPLVFQGFDSPACHNGIGVRRADDDSFRSGGDEAFHAGRRFSVMTAGFEGNIDGGAFRRFRCAVQGIDFRMSLSEFLMIALPDDAIVFYDD